VDADHRLLVTHALDVAGLVRAAARPDTQDHSGYRRYDAGAVVELIRIETLAGAGVPPARLRAQSRQRERHRARIARLASGRGLAVPPEVGSSGSSGTLDPACRTCPGRVAAEWAGRSTPRERARSRTGRPPRSRG